MTHKKKFDVENPEVVLLNNGRYAYRAECPWRGKNDKVLYAFKFASAEAYRTHILSMQREEEEEEVEDAETGAEPSELVAPEPDPSPEPDSV